MKKNTIALALALATFGAAQAGLFDWGKQKLGQAKEAGTKAVEKGKAAYTQYGPTAQQGLTKGQELYQEHGQKVGGVIGEEKAGLVGQGLGAAQSGLNKAGSLLGNSQ